MTSPARLASLALVLLVAGCDRAPDQATARGNCRLAAMASVEAFAKRDVDAVVRLMHPAGLEAGKTTPDAMKGKVRKLFAEMDANGAKFDPPVLRGPAEVFAGGARHFAIVDESVTIRHGPATIAAQSYLLGISEDAGRTWRFLDGAGVKRMDLAKVLPDYPLAERPLPVMPKPTVTLAAAR